ncbi:hypothetical protein ABIC63_005629 [Pseudacidovorax sp. 1753]|uniref:hypothetical protein n=1 Tax=Pseudacidovorax sp. 1753 TaxID=3156419 RepID=UPI003391B789
MISAARKASIKRHATDWALGAIVATFILALTVGKDEAPPPPPPAVADAIEGARLAARERDLPVPWPPR